MDEELAQLREVSKTMATPGWGYLLQLLGFERERQIGLVKKADTATDFNYQRGMLYGFDAVVAVFDRTKKRIEAEAEASAKGDSHEG